MPKKDPKRSSVIEDNLMLNVIKKYLKLAGGVSAVWLMGYYGVSVSWIWIVLVPYVWKNRLTKAKKHKTAISQEVARDEKAVILARVEDLPSWVYFPDVERAEWVNKIIRQMWPYIGEFVEKILRESVEPSVRKSLPAALQSFKFSTIDLGDIPPRTGGIKVYSQLKRDEIYMDLELNYSSDCDIAVNIKGINAGIKDFRLHGTLRVVFKPLMNKPPLIAGMRVFFLNNPEVDFDLTSLANAFDLPGLSDMLHSIILEQIANLMVLPNVFPIKLADVVDLNKLRYPQPQGVVRVKIVEAKDLIAADFKLVGKGTSDPYAVVKVGAKTVKTSVINNTLTPVWNETFEMIVDSADGQLLYIDVLDDDPGSKDDELGRVSMDLSKLKNDGFEDEWLPLEGVKQGTIHVQLTWLWLANDPEELERVLGSGQATENSSQEKEQEDDQTYTAMLLVFLDSAMNLPRGKKSLQEPSPQAVLTVGQQTMESSIKQNTNEPRWEQSFRFMLQSPHYQNLEVEVNDTNTKQLIGDTTIKLKELLEAEDMVMDQKFHIKASDSDAYVNMRLALRILTPRASPEWVEEDDALGQLAAATANNNNAAAGPEIADAAAKKDVKSTEKQPAKAAVTPKEEPKEVKAVEETKLKAEREAKASKQSEKEKRVQEVKQKTEAELDAEVKLENEPKQEDPTLFPFDGFDPDVDAQVLSKAMSKTFGADEDAIINVLGKRSQTQREQIALTYKTKYGKELPKDLKNKLKGNFENICVEMLLGPAEFDAKQLYKAMKGLGSDEQVLIEVICTRTNEQLNNIKAAYKTVYKKDLEAAVVDDTSGDFQRLLVGCLQARRPEGTHFDRNRAKKDAQELLAAGEKNWGTNESTFQKILVTRSYAQLRATFQEYAKLANKDIEDTIRSELSGDLEKAMLTIVQVIRGKANYFAKALYKSMKGIGTDDDTLVRVVASRCEVDMVQIKEEFQKEYKKTLESFVSEDASGDYKKMLLTLIAGDGNAKSDDAAKIKAEREAKAKVEQEARAKAEQEARAKAEQEAKAKAEQAARAKADQEAKAKAEQEARAKAEQAARAKAEQEARAKAEQEARAKAEQEARAKAEQEARAKAEQAARAKAEQEARAKAEQEARAKAEQEARAKAEQEARAKAAEEAKIKAEEAAKVKAEREAAKQSENEKRVEEVKQKTEEELNEEVKLENEPKQEDATLFPQQGFNPSADCEVLSKAMAKTFGTDEDAIISVLGKRSQAQREQIALTYKTKYGKELSKDLSKLKGNFKNLCVEMLLGPAEFDAKQLYKAMKGLGSDEKVLVEIICTRTNEQLNNIKAAYKTVYKKDLEAAVVDDTSGDFQRLLVGCLQAKRHEGTHFDRNRARQDAQELLAAGEKNWGTNESAFQKILVTRSYAQLRATFQEYAKIANKDIEDTIRSELSGDLEKGMLTIVQVIRGKAGYFAKTLYKSMKGMGTDDDTLVRVVASRCEVDMVQIKEEFQKDYKKTLGQFISEDTSGDYRKMLLTLIADNEAKR